MKKYIRENILSLSPYSTARDEYDGNKDIVVFLDANENPYNEIYNRYPDPYQKELKELISLQKDIPADRIFIGNGSDEAIDVLLRVFCEPKQDKIVTIKPTYGMYKVAAAINDIECVEVALDNNFDICAQKVMNAIDSNVKMIILCSPNNPTGNLLTRCEVEEIITSFDGVVVIDEAYIDFSRDKGFISLIEECENLVILQTLSKAWGMAALRVGMAFASPTIIEYMSRVKYPYNINAMSQMVAINKLTRGRNKLDIIISERNKLIEILKKFKFIERVYPSDTNFVMIRCTDAENIYNHLLHGGVLVRNRSGLYGCSNCLRLTVGTPEENMLLINKLEDYETSTIYR